MLDKTEMSRRVTFALDNARSGTAAAIAAELGITEQAVSGWRKTGKLAKTRIHTLAKHTGRRVEYFLDADVTDDQSDSESSGSLKHELHEIRLVLSAMAGVMVSHRPAEAAELVSALSSLSTDPHEGGLAQHLVEVLSDELGSRAPRSKGGGGP